MTESQQIKEAFVKLRDFGNIVFNFNSNIPNRAGIKGHPDWEILTKKLNVVFVETKIGRDTIKPDQKPVLERLSSIMGMPNSRVYYYIVKTSKDAENIQKDILNGKL